MANEIPKRVIARIIDAAQQLPAMLETAREAADSFMKARDFLQSFAPIVEYMAKNDPDEEERKLWAGLLKEMGELDLRQRERGLQGELSCLKTVVGTLNVSIPRRKILRKGR